MRPAASSHCRENRCCLCSRRWWPRIERRSLVSPPICRWPNLDRMSHARCQVTESLRQLAEGSATAIGFAHIELPRQCRWCQRRREACEAEPAARRPRRGPRRAAGCSRHVLKQRNIGVAARRLPRRAQRVGAKHFARLHQVFGQRLTRSLRERRHAAATLGPLDNPYVSVLNPFAPLRLFRSSLRAKCQDPVGADWPHRTACA